MTIKCKTTIGLLVLLVLDVFSYSDLFFFTPLIQVLCSHHFIYINIRTSYQIMHQNKVCILKVAFILINLLPHLFF